MVAVAGGGCEKFRKSKVIGVGYVNRPSSRYVRLLQRTVVCHSISPLVIVIG